MTEPHSRQSEPEDDASVSIEDAEYYSQAIQAASGAKTKVCCPNCKRTLGDVFESIVRQRGKFKGQREKARADRDRLADWIEANVEGSQVVRYTDGSWYVVTMTEPLPTPSVAAIVDELHQNYTPEGVMIWLMSRHRLLEGRRAIDLLNDEAGRAEVYAVARGLSEGVFL